MTEDVPVITLSGDAGERGLAHGTILRPRVQSCVELYSLVLGRTEQQIREIVPGFERAIRAAAPDLATELDAIAEGADVARHWIYALNARSELVPLGVPECTAVFAPGAGLLGQTWDWLRPLADLFVFVRIERPDGHRILTLTEPGMLAKIGCNSAGIGVCLNFLPLPRTTVPGVPVHVVLRMLLETADVDEAETVARAIGPGPSGNVLVGAPGRGFDMEYDGRAHHVEPIETGAFSHTNHHLGFIHDAGPSAANSYARLDRARALGTPTNLAAFQKLLSDQDDPEHPICAPYTPTFGVDIGTICTVVMELDAGRMHVRRGPDPAAPWSTLALS